MATVPIVFRVTGTPAPKGSGRAILIGGRAVHVAGGSNVNGARIRSWSSSVTDAWAALARPGWSTEAIGIAIIFRLPMRRGDVGKHGPKPGAPLVVTVKPDGDKLVRATLDALTTAGAWTDDAQVAEVRASRVYLPPALPCGASIYVAPVNRFFPMADIRALSAAYESELTHLESSLASAKEDANRSSRMRTIRARSVPSSPGCGVPGDPAPAGAGILLAPVRGDESPVDGGTLSLPFGGPGAW